MVPHFAGRLASPLEDPDRDDILGSLKRDPMDYFREFYADTAMFGAAHAVRCAVDFFGADHVLFGTDMPLGGPNVVADTIADINSLGLADADTAAIFAGNALRLLVTQAYLVTGGAGSGRPSPGRWLAPGTGWRSAGGGRTRWRPRLARWTSSATSSHVQVVRS
jgi:Amidohydrolase